MSYNKIISCWYVDINLWSATVNMAADEALKLE